MSERADLWYLVTFDGGRATFITRQPSETDARNRARVISPRGVIASVSGYRTKEEADAASTPAGG